MSKTAHTLIALRAKLYISTLLCGHPFALFSFVNFGLGCVLAKRVMLFSSCLSLMRREYGSTKESAKDMHAQLCACELLVGLPNTRSELSLRVMHISGGQLRDQMGFQNNLLFWHRKNVNLFTHICCCFWNVLVALNFRVKNLVTS